MKNIKIIEAKEHNLKNITVHFPRNQFIVVTGPSGSGKSTLIYDCLHKESQRKYLESLFSSATLFSESSIVPARVKSIENLSPTLAIDQKTTSLWPRMSVGTVSEIYDFLRLYFTHCCDQFCLSCSSPLSEGSFESFIDNLEVDHYKIYSPQVVHKKLNLESIIQELLEEGYEKALLDGEEKKLSSMKVKKNVYHTLEVLIDEQKKESTLFEYSLKVALKKSINKSIKLVGKKTYYFSQKNYCYQCQKSYLPLIEGYFSFNSPLGSCRKCQGLGVVKILDEIKILQSFQSKKDLSKNFNISIGSLSDKILSYEEKIKLIHEYKDFFLEKEDFILDETCSECLGKRLNKENERAKLQGKSIGELALTELGDLKLFFSSVKRKNPLEEKLLKEITQRIDLLCHLGLDYLFLHRSCISLSGGEYQRIRLCRQISEDLSGMIYILDEPTIGLHPSDHAKLITTFKKLRDLNNTVIVIEHDQDIIYQSDYLIALGPKGGSLGGNLLYEGPTKNYHEKPFYPQLVQAREIKKWHQLKIEKKYNLEERELKIPLDVFCCVTGVSGSGKSTLVHEIIYKNLIKNNISTCLLDQRPIGKTSRSNLLTYLKLLDPIRKLFASLTESQKRGFTSSDFSFNSKGACPHCSGSGEEVFESFYLENFSLPCSLCEGSRYKESVLDLYFQSKNIHQVLSMSVEEALNFFEFHQEIANSLSLLQDIGLGYLTLGQSSSSLSGGEAQRLKIASELLKKKKPATVYLLDEPTTGLHRKDIDILVQVLEKLLVGGHGLIIIEHNPELILKSDYILDMGPEGGRRGGQILFEGPLQDFLKTSTKTSLILNQCLKF